ncbi:MAG: aldo/keto reductase [Rhodospirillales bacterium]|nr:aldo/keto reductase [Rhodospirillales bacterium]
MKYRQLGRTEAQVSELIFSCGEVVGMMAGDDIEAAFLAVQRALEAGINWFDTAPGAGAGKAEENLGKILKDLDASPHISCKVHVDPEKSEDIYSQVERSLEQSLKRLQVDRIELYQLYNWIEGSSDKCALNAEDVLGRVGAIDAMEKLRDKGLISWIGATALGDTGLSRRLIESKRIDTAQVYINMINPTAAHKDPVRTLDAGRPKASRGQDFTGVLNSCSENDVGVIAIRTLAAGAMVGASQNYLDRIVTRDTDLEDVQFKADALKKLLGNSQGSLAQAAIRFVLAQPAIACINFGIGNQEHLEDGIKAVEMGPLPVDVMESLDRLYQSDFGRK